MNPTPTIAFRQNWASDITVESPPGNNLVYRYPPTLTKPCVHPLVTPAGHVLSGFEMSDHPWHRGLWFTIKYMNGVNFWEETPPFGIQKSNGEPRATLLSDRSAGIEHQLEWTAAAGGLAIREERSLVTSSDDAGIGCIDWSTTLHAQQDLLLDRTPFTTWGGYGGLIFRASRELHDARFITPGAEPTQAMTGQTGPWAALEGLMDGGKNQRVSLAMFDHPSNPRSPSPWYGKCINGYNFMNAAFLFHEPLQLGKGEALSFRYRILYRDGLWSPDELDQLSVVFTSSEPTR